MIDGSEKCKCQLAFELQNSCVYEKHGKLSYYSCCCIPVTQGRRGAFSILVLGNRNKEFLGSLF